MKVLVTLAFCGASFVVASAALSTVEADFFVEFLIAAGVGVVFGVLAALAISSVD